jgi:hypothetical protein
MCESPALRYLTDVSRIRGFGVSRFLERLQYSDEEEMEEVVPLVCVGVVVLS